MGIGTCEPWYACGSQRKTSGVLVLSYCIGLGDQAQVIKIRNDHLYPMSHLAGPGFLAVDQESLDSTLDLPNQCFFTKWQTVRVVTCSKGAMWYVLE